MRRQVDSQEHIRLTLAFDPLRKPIVGAAIRALRPAPGSHGLDAGCGIGLPGLQLAETVGPGGHVTGVDIAPDFLRRAAQRAQDASLAERLSFRDGDIARLDFADATFDWAWSMDCLGMIPADPFVLLRELARVVRPGGFVAILLYASQQLLPGYPLLEARLNATTAGLAPFTGRTAPATHAMRALGWFREAGLVRGSAQTFIQTVHAPLSAPTRAALLSLLEMRWEGAEDELAAEDVVAYRRLCRPEATDCILDLPDYYGFFTYALFRGEV
jgi:ubiquinone/menaquinone biosynthesis C-methylase UbiE